jgi:hypothetical protein
LSSTAGTGSEIFEKAITDGMGMALSGSDLTAHMQRMASAMGQWESTGLSIDQDSLGRMGNTLAHSVGGIRGSNIAMGITQAGQRMATSGGPQNASQFLMMQDMFGFGSKGGGSEDFAQTMLDMSEGKSVKGGLENFVNRSAGTGSKAEQGLVLSRRFQKAGVTVSQRDAMNMMNGDSEAYARTEKALRGAMGYDVKADGKSRVDGGVRNKAALENSRIAAGDRLIPAMQSMEKISTNMLSSFSGFSTEINLLTSVLASFSKDASTLVNNAHAGMSLVPTGSQ